MIVSDFLTNIHLREGYEEIGLSEHLCRKKGGGKTDGDGGQQLDGRRPFLPVDGCMIEHISLKKIEGKDYCRHLPVFSFLCSVSVDFTGFFGCTKNRTSFSVG